MEVGRDQHLVAECSGGNLTWFRSSSPSSSEISGSKVSVPGAQSLSAYRSTLPIRTRRPPWDSSLQDPRHGPIVESYGVAFSYERGTPVGPFGHLEAALAALPFACSLFSNCRGASLIRNRRSLGRCSKPMSRVLWGGVFLWTMYPCRPFWPARSCPCGVVLCFFPFL